MLSKLYLEFKNTRREINICKDWQLVWTDILILTQGNGYLHPLEVKGGDVRIAVNNRRYWLPLDCFNVI
jgi:hypothetical protein